VQALEYATETKALTVGKPEASFFNLALQDIGLPSDQVGMMPEVISRDKGMQVCKGF
jgi:ribonucleotide monophosphatase NagD (HAD superfamily)